MKTFTVYIERMFYIDKGNMEDAGHAERI